MLRLLALYLPVLFPSWRFFKEVEPSARVEYCHPGGPWQAANARPERLRPLAMLARLVWNPDWNERLFLMSLAERMVVEPTAHAEAEILARLARRSGIGPGGRYRILLVDREGEAISRVVALEGPGAG